jgi:hypothetical protein
MKNKPMNLSSISQLQIIWIALKGFNENGTCRMNSLNFLEQLACIFSSILNNKIVTAKIFLNQRFYSF